MTEYLANQIILGKLSYSFVMLRKPELKSEIDNELALHGRSNLIEGG